MPTPSMWVKRGFCFLVLPLLLACNGLGSQPTPQPPGYTVSGRTMGDPNAQVTLVVFADFQWPYCKDFAVDAARRLDEEYVKTGKIKFTFKYYPVLDRGPTGESHWAAQAAECANEQGKFWQYHDKLYIKWLGENIGMYQKLNLKKFAADLKLDRAKFNDCLESDKTASVVQEDIAEGRKLQVPGTPTFFINGKPLQIRSLEFEEFQRLIDPYLQ